MKISVLKSKIHTARVTESNLHYEGSIAIDEALMEESGIKEYEKVLVANFTNGNRYETYAIKAQRGTRTISVNGAGARYSCVGDTITIFAFAQVEEFEEIKPRQVNALRATPLRQSLHFQPTNKFSLIGRHIFP